MADQIFARSKSLFERARELIPAGVSSNSRFREPHPTYFRAAKGAEIWDADGNRYIDLILGNGAVILGHGDPRIEEAIRKSLECGLTIGVEWERVAELAEIFLDLVKTVDMVRFTNTGTEAMLHALHIARSATGRSRIAKAEGCYHGWTDPFFVSAFHDPAKAGPVNAMRSLPGTPGLDPGAVEDTVVFPFNDIENSVATIEAHADDLAAVFVEPVMIDIGYVQGRREYLHALQAVCEKNGIIFVLDEVLTSFRLAPGGAQEFYDLRPGLSIYGKAMGNGYPLAAVAGKEELMRLTEPGKGPAFVGTYNGHALSVAVALSVLPLLADGEAQRNLEEATVRLRSCFESCAAKRGFPGRLAGGAGHFQWYFNSDDVVDYRTAAASDAAKSSAFAAGLVDRGILAGTGLLFHQALSLAHTNAILEEIEEAFADSMDALVGG